MIYITDIALSYFSACRIDLNTEQVYSQTTLNAFGPSSFCFLRLGRSSFPGVCFLLPAAVGSAFFLRPALLLRAALWWLDCDSEVTWSCLWPRTPPPVDLRSWWWWWSSWCGSVAPPRCGLLRSSVLVCFLCCLRSLLMYVVLEGLPTFPTAKRLDVGFPLLSSTSGRSRRFLAVAGCWLLGMLDFSVPPDLPDWCCCLLLELVACVWKIRFGSKKALGCVWFDFALSEFGFLCLGCASIWADAEPALVSCACAWVPWLNLWWFFRSPLRISYLEPTTPTTSAVS